MRPVRLLPPLLLLPLLVSSGPCDIYSAAGTPCVAAHSVTRALYASYSGPLYQVTRLADNATLNIAPVSAGGAANAAAQDAFCGGSSPTSPPPVNSTVNLTPLSLPAFSFRHCDAQGFVTETDLDQDHDFVVVPALNGQAGALSFRSVNYPTYFIAPMTDDPAEPGRVGVVEAPQADDASWSLAPASSPSSSSFTLTCLGPTRNGAVLGVGTNLTGSCAGNYAPPAASVYLVDPASSPGPLPGSTSWSFTSNAPGPCAVTRLYDQSPMGNHLDVAPAGGAHNAPDSPVDATKLKLTLGGREVYGAYFQGGMGYRRDNTTGVATGNEPETILMVTAGAHYNNGCCFDYGNAETNNHDDGAGTMECVYFGTWNATASGWCGGAGQGPWVVSGEGSGGVKGGRRGRGTSREERAARAARRRGPPTTLASAQAGTLTAFPPTPIPTPTPPQMSDLEDGLWACGSRAAINPNVTGFSSTPFVTAMVKGGENGFALKGGDATVAGSLATLYDGPRPPGYQPMKKQGALILGIGGDNSDSAIGTFFEGLVLAGLSSDEADDAVQADIAAAGYSMNA
jgi:non-reducing end alpha-L-arabinofuranosidase